MEINVRTNYPLYLAWFTATAAMLGSLYFSEVLKLAPCVLCWYQRIFMYPLAVILPIGIVHKDKLLPKYVIPLSAIGGAIALYQYLLAMKIIPEALAPCQSGVSCVTQPIEWFGFVNIPLLSLVAFTVITLSMIYYSKLKNND